MTLIARWREEETTFKCSWKQWDCSNQLWNISSLNPRGDSILKVSNTDFNTRKLCRVWSNCASNTFKDASISVVGIIDSAYQFTKIILWTVLKGWSNTTRNNSDLKHWNSYRVKDINHPLNLISWRMSKEIKRGAIMRLLKLSLAKQAKNSISYWVYKNWSIPIHTRMTLKLLTKLKTFCLIRFKLLWSIIRWLKIGGIMKETRICKSFKIIDGIKTYQFWDQTIFVKISLRLNWAYLKIRRILETNRTVLCSNKLWTPNLIFSCSTIIRLKLYLIQIWSNVRGRSWWKTKEIIKERSTSIITLRVNWRKLMKEIRREKQKT